MDTIEITITPEDFRKATSYMSYECPLKQALTTKFPKVPIIQVSGIDVHIGSLVYDIPWVEIWGGPQAEYSSRRITQLCTLAKTDTTDIPTITLKLTRSQENV